MPVDSIGFHNLGVESKLESIGEKLGYIVNLIYHTVSIDENRLKVSMVVLKKREIKGYNQIKVGLEVTKNIFEKVFILNFFHKLLKRYLATFLLQTDETIYE